MIISLIKVEECGIQLEWYLAISRKFSCSVQLAYQLICILFQVISGSSKLAQLAWVTAQQRDNLNRLIVARPDCTPAACLRKANTLDSTIFVDGYKVLGFQVCTVQQIF